jgi:hypothetical protein
VTPRFAALFAAVLMLTIAMFVLELLGIGTLALQAVLAVLLIVLVLAGTRSRDEED